MSSVQETVRPRGSLFGLLRRLHFYIGLFIAPFIFVVALTGTLYVLTPQIEHQLYASALNTEAQGVAQPLSAQIAAARRHIGEAARIYAVRPAPDSHETTRVQFSQPNLGPSESRSVFIDPYTLRVTGDMTVYGTSGVLPLRMWLDQLHRGLLLGDVGRAYSELAASWLWVAALGGIVLWLGTRPRRADKAKRVGFAFARHWHIKLGLTLALGLVFFSVTGLTWSQWAGGNIDKMRSELGWLTPQVRTALDAHTPVATADPHADYHAMPQIAGMAMGGMARPTFPPALANAANGDWDGVLSAARRSGIHAAKVELRQPKGDGQAWTVSEIDRSWPSHVDAVSVDPASFAIVDRVEFAHFPLVAKLTRWGVDAHMGVLFGLPNQLLLAFFGVGLCAIIALGYRIWWIRRPALPALNPAQTLLSAWLALPRYAQEASLIVALALGWALPMMGASLLAFLAIDLLHWRRAAAPQTYTPPDQQSPLGIVRGRFAKKQKEMRYFLRSVAVLWLIVGAVMGKAIVSGVIEQYQIAFSDWSLLMYVTQALMVLLYTSVFTGLMSIPLWYFFLGESDEQGK
ncbi:DUF2534 family protein [Candidatus Pantoea persica]|uniref:DUF2534 family protein n=1 Tax=Candidatus Pantoea persica TaxID=2518128 RepID=UPI00215D6656|nr:DUF2534 family protein [Candidatus Pantoea persica]MBA2813949.1 putative iron-regulated membrane protein [Candidatus Pantoea persica]